MKTLFTILLKHSHIFYASGVLQGWQIRRNIPENCRNLLKMSSFKRKIEIITVLMDTSENNRWKLTSSKPSIFRRKVQFSAVSKTYISYFEARKYIQYALFFFHGDWVLIATEGNTDFLRILISASML